jgi:hypothetical protein
MGSPGSSDTGTLCRSVPQTSGAHKASACAAVSPCGVA